MLCVLFIRVLCERKTFHELIRVLKTSVNSVCSVRDKPSQRVRKLSQESLSEPFCDDMSHS